MPDNNIHTIETKLEQLKKCICNEALKNAVFAKKLEAILLGDYLSEKIVKDKSKKNDIFNVVEYLGQNGEDKLRNELDTKTNTELKDIIRAEGIEKGKALSNLERNEMIEKIVKHSHSSLMHGASFLNKQAQTTVSPSSENLEKQQKEKVIKLANDLRDKGLSYRKIAEELNKQRFKTSSGREWKKGSVSNLLK